MYRILENNGGMAGHRNGFKYAGML